MAVIVRCKRGKANKEAPELSDPLIITDRMAVLKGKRFLDDPNQGAYYRVKRRTLKVPHKNSAVIPSKWVRVTESKLGVRAAVLKVREYSINITPNQIWATMTTDGYEEPS